MTADTLIPLRQIPHSAREIEAGARRSHATRAAARTAARYRIVDAPGVR